MITFYDVPSDASKTRTCSPNTWKHRFVLNFKNILYKTVWIEFQDISAEMRKLGAPPTREIEGIPHYTLPAIYDPSTRTAVADSQEIVRYLEKTYPDAKPTLIPEGTAALQAAFMDTHVESLLQGTFLLLVYAIMEPLPPASKEYFRRTREKWIGARLEDIAPKDEEQREKMLGAVLDTLNKIAGWMDANGEGKLFVMGDNVSNVDVGLAAYFRWVRDLHGEDGLEWAKMKEANGGRWEKLSEAFSRWQTVT